MQEREGGFDVSPPRRAKSPGAFWSHIRWEIKDKDGPITRRRARVSFLPAPPFGGGGLGLLFSTEVPCFLLKRVVELAVFCRGFAQSTPPTHPPGGAGERLSQQLHRQLFSKVHLIYLI